MSDTLRSFKAVIVHETKSVSSIEWDGLVDIVRSIQDIITSEDSLNDEEQLKEVRTVLKEYDLNV